MAETCSDTLNEIKDAAKDIVWAESRAADHLSDVFAHLLLFEYNEATEDLYAACADIKSMAAAFGGWNPYPWEGPLWYYLENCVSGVTMESILSALMTASNEEYKQFIGIVDAYRVALMNQPFNAEFYAALARGFAE